MKKSLSGLLVVSVLLSILTASPAFAASKKKTPPPVQVPVIASVSPTAITVSEAKVTKTFTITQFTEINVNGQRATVAELKPGMTVSITLGTDPSKAARINASGAPK